MSLAVAYRGMFTAPGQPYSNALSPSPLSIRVRVKRGKVVVLHPLAARPCRCATPIEDEDGCVRCGRIAR